MNNSEPAVTNLPRTPVQGHRRAHASRFECRSTSFERSHSEPHCSCTEFLPHTKCSLKFKCVYCIHLLNYYPVFFIEKHSLIYITIGRKLNLEKLKQLHLLVYQSKKLYY